MSKRSTYLLIDDMLEAIGKLERFTAGYDYEKFIKEDKTTDAVVRNLEIIGEAAGHHGRLSAMRVPRGIVEFRFALPTLLSMSVFQRMGNPSETESLNLALMKNALARRFQLRGEYCMGACTSQALCQSAIDR